MKNKLDKIKEAYFLAQPITAKDLISVLALMELNILTTIDSVRGCPHQATEEEFKELLDRVKEGVLSVIIKKEENND